MSIITNRVVPVKPPACGFKCIIDLQARTSSRPRQSTARAPDSCYCSKLAANQDQDSKPNTDLKQVRKSSGWYGALLFRDLFSEYQIPGTPRPGLCHFTYRSTSRLEGRFNSPRHPQNYPNDLNCTYLFLATPSQQVTPEHQISSQRWFMCL